MQPKYRDELKEISPHALLKCSSDATTLGIREQVRSVYIEGRRQPWKGQYYFAYRIRITNNSTRPVQLLRRHWIITDANGKTENVWVQLRVDGIADMLDVLYELLLFANVISVRLYYHPAWELIGLVSSIEGNVKTCWYPEMTADTTTSSYWLTWKLGSVLSMYGCYAQRNKVLGDRADSEMADSGQSRAAYPPQGRNGAKDDLDLNDHRHTRQVSGFWGYAFQIIFQINAGAVVLTDCVFWFVIVPFLSTTRNFDLNFFVVNMHSVNILFLLGDTALNSLVSCVSLITVVYIDFIIIIFVIVEPMIWLLSAIPVVPNRIFHAMDDIIRELPMGPSCLLFHRVAVPILGLVNFTCSSLVRYSRSNACPMLRRVHPSDKDEEPSLVEILPRVFPGLEVIQPRRDTSTTKRDNVGKW
ncbi:ApaG-like protein [Drosera capensis]